MIVTLLICLVYVICLFTYSVRMWAALWCTRLDVPFLSSISSSVSFYLVCYCHLEINKTSASLLQQYLDNKAVILALTFVLNSKLKIAFICDIYICFDIFFFNITKQYSIF